MNKDEIYQLIKNLASDIFNIPIDQINLNSKYNSLENWDSLNHLNLFLSLEEKTNVNFSAKEISELTSIGKIVDNLYNKINLK
jgi:acyl carrier protein